MKSKWMILAVVLAGVGATAFFVVRSRNKTTNEGEVVAVKRGRIQVSVQEVGSVEPLRKVEIKSKVSGQVLEVMVDVGDRVKAGDTLMRLDPLDANRDMREAYARAEVTVAQLKVSKAQFEFKQKAHQSGALSDLDLAVA